MVFKKGEKSAFAGWHHTAETRAKIGLAQKGHARPCSTEAKALLSKAFTGRRLSGKTKMRIANGIARYLAQWPKPQTLLERTLINLLEGVGFAIDEQVQFGRYIVDAYDPENGLAWEADGSFWHQDKEKEDMRDEYLLGHGVAAVIHLSEQDLKGVD